jgi:hypothetical protein
MGVLNLILGVVVNVFTSAHDRIQQEIVLEERIQKLEEQQHLRRICESLDNGGCGELTKDQMADGFDTNEDFRNVMETLEVTEDDLEIVWTIIDTDKVGSVSYTKFVDQVYLMKDNDTHFMLAYIKYYITKIKETLLLEIQGNKEMFNRVAEAQGISRVAADEKSILDNVSPLLKAGVRRQSSPGGLAGSPSKCGSFAELTPTSIHQNVPPLELASNGVDVKRANGEVDHATVCVPQNAKSIALQNAMTKIQRSLDYQMSDIRSLVKELLPENQISL